jgi:hypothetical protein
VYKSEVTCLEVEWLINDPKGLDFLNAILGGDNPDVYENQAIQRVIEFLFQLFKQRIMVIRFPLYIGQIFVIHAMISQNPSLHDGYMVYSSYTMDICLVVVNSICLIGSIFMLAC